MSDATCSSSTSIPKNHCHDEDNVLVTSISFCAAGTKGSNNSTVGEEKAEWWRFPAKTSCFLHVMFDGL
jgi:hypothetical protein